RGPSRAVGGDAGPVDQAGLAELPVAGPAAVGGGPGDAISWAMWAIGRRGWAPIRPTRVSLPGGGQPGGSVGHEASGERGAVTARTSLGGLTSRQQPLGQNN